MYVSAICCSLKVMYFSCFIFFTKCKLFLCLQSHIFLFQVFSLTEDAGIPSLQTFVLVSGV